jgi:integrase
MAKQVYEKTKVRGVSKQHARGCPGGKCNCDAQFQATVYSARDARKIRKTFPTQREAEVWRGEIRGAVDQGRMRAPSKVTVAQAATSLLSGMRDGSIQNRSGRRYKPSVTRRYELALRLHIEPAIGHTKLTDLGRAAIKALVAKWVRAGMPPSTIRNCLDPLRVIVREAIEDGRLAVDPIAGMRLPTGQGRRERVADQAEAHELIKALTSGEQALWACAFYGGLRRGELRALAWADVDFRRGRDRGQARLG